MAHTFDGQNIHIDAVTVKDAVWIRVSAEADKSTPTMQRQEAGLINARAAQWAYKLSADKGRLLTRTRDNLLTKAEYTFERGKELGGAERGHGDLFAVEAAFKF